MYGLLVHMGQNRITRATCGFILSLGWSVYFQEALPFNDYATNTVAFAATWSVVLCCFVVLLLIADEAMDRAFGLDETIMSTLTLVANVGIYVLFGLHMSKLAREAAAKSAEEARIKAQVEELEAKAKTMYTATADLGTAEAYTILHVAATIDLWASPGVVDSPGASDAGEVALAHDAAVDLSDIDGVELGNRGKAKPATAEDQDPRKSRTPFPIDELPPESEPFLLLSEGELVNVLSRRDDGWW